MAGFAVGLGTVDVGQQWAAPLWVAVLLGCLAALATLGGWVLAAARAEWPAWVQAAALGAAGLAMIAISVGEVLPEAVQSGVSPVTVGVVFTVGVAVAVAIVIAGHRLLAHQSRLARTAPVVAATIALHNIPEGTVPVGLTLVSLQAAVITTIFLAAHNVLEGVAISAPVIAAGQGRRKALHYTSIAVLGELLGVVAAVFFAEALSSARVGLMLALVAGIMVTISVTELLPAAYTGLRGSARTVTGGRSGT